ncbi:hypothetical protein D3C85_98700 [compost metagenome]
MGKAIPRFGTKVPAPELEPSLLLDFKKLEVDGRWCIVPVSDADDVIASLDVDQLNVTDVRMTQAQYDKLPDFSGF